MSGPDGGRRLLVLSSGSWEASILGRNAVNRLRTARMDGLFDTVDYVFLPTPGDAVHAVEPGFTVYDVSGGAGVGLTGGAGRIARIWRFLAELAERGRAPDVVSAVEPFLSGALALALGRRIGRPVVIQVVSNYRISWEVGRLNPLPVLPAPASFALESFVLRSADAVLADTDHYVEYAVGRGAPRARTELIPRYADPGFRGVRRDPDFWEPHGVADRAPVVYVGRLGPEKYALDLARVFERVGAAEPGRHFVVFGGGGPQEEEFLRRVGAAGIGGRVHVLRGLERGELARGMASSGALLATHAGYALLEAALCGAPVVAYAYEWHPEVVDDGRTGRLVPYRDAEAMAAATLDLLRNPRRARAMGEALRARAETTYGVERTVRALRSTYLKAMGEAPWTADAPG